MHCRLQCRVGRAIRFRECVIECRAVHTTVYMSKELHFLYFLYNSTRLKEQGSIHQSHLVELAYTDPTTTKVHCLPDIDTRTLLKMYSQWQLLGYTCSITGSLVLVSCKLYRPSSAPRNTYWTAQWRDKTHLKDIYHTVEPVYHLLTILAGLHAERSRL